MSEQQLELDPSLREVVNALKGNFQWRLFREKVIEFRIKQAHAQALRPCNTQDQWMEAERMKGAAVALQGLLYLFDAELPKSKTARDEDEQ